MTGVEIAGLALGAIPIVIEILKSYRTTRDRFDAFRTYTHVANEVQISYTTAAACFSNDCQFLLQTVVEDGHTVSQMIADAEHAAWLDPQLEKRFRSFLGTDYSLFGQIITLIRDILRDTKEALKECLQELPNGNGLQYTTAQRLFLAFNTSRKENRYRKWLDGLDNWNKKLSRLRKQRCKLRKQRVTHTGYLVRKAVPRRYGDIQVASQRLHESLQESWSCTNITHTGHLAKLSLEAKAEYGNVRLDMVIACRQKSVIDDQTLAHSEDPIWLQVRTVTTHESIIQPKNMPKADVSNALMPQLVTPLMNPPTNSKSLMNKAKRKLKTVRFDAAIDDRTNSSKVGGPMLAGTTCTVSVSDNSSTQQDNVSQSFVTLDLKATNSVCCHLSKCCSTAATHMDPCLGYLEHIKATLPSRLIFYSASKNAEDKGAQSGMKTEAMPIAFLLHDFRELHQLTLAHQLAVAALQYHSTSWLASDWSLQDVSYFKSSSQIIGKHTSKENSDELSKQLQSLHLSTQFPRTGSGTVDNTPSAQWMRIVRAKYGIRNLPLAKLGVALLEVGCQQTISNLAARSTSTDDVGSTNSAASNNDPSHDSSVRDISCARELLQDPPSSLDRLGKRYLKIVQKCVDCDFSCGEDLDSDELQSAVYTDIVCGLETLITEWKRFLGIS